MFNLSVNILQLTIQITTCAFFWSQLTQRRFAFLWTILFATVPATTIMLMTMHSDWSYSFISILKLASCVLLYWLLFRGRFWRKVKILLLTAVISACCTIPVERLCALIYGMHLEDLNPMSAVRIVGMILLQDALFIAEVCTVIIIQRKNFSIKGQGEQLWIMLVFMLLHMLFVGVYFLDDTALHRKTDCIVQLVFQLVLIVNILIQYYSALHTQILLQKSQELRQMQMQQQFNFDYYTLAEQRFTEISRLRHDIRNLMQTVSILSEDCTQQQTAARLVEDIRKRLNQTKAVQFCEHPLLNTILTLKLQNEHTDLVADIVLRDISDLPMREQALCSYFVMLMDTVAQVFAQSATHGAAFGLRSGKNAHFYVVKIIFPESVALQNVRQTILQNRMLRVLIEEHHGMENIATTDDFITVTMAFPLAT